MGFYKPSSQVLRLAKQKPDLALCMLQLTERSYLIIHASNLQRSFSQSYSVHGLAAHLGTLCFSTVTFNSASAFSTILYICEIEIYQKQYLLGQQVSIL